MKCRGGVAQYDAVEDRLTLWSSTQTPHAASAAWPICWLRREPSASSRPTSAAASARSSSFYGEEVAWSPLAALLLHRPVKWIEDRREHFIATTQERDQYWDARDRGRCRRPHARRARHAAPRQRRLHRARRERAVRLGVDPDRAYVVPALDSTSSVALTNKVPVTPVRGAGQPQGVFVMERLLDRRPRARPRAGAFNSSAVTWNTSTRARESAWRNSHRFTPAISAPLPWETRPSRYHSIAAASRTARANASGVSAKRRSTRCRAARS